MRTSSIPILLAVGLAVTTALPEKQEKIIGGSETTIENYPYVSAILFGADLSDFIQVCMGNIINNRAILTVARCFNDKEDVSRWRIRVGSSYANSGGSVHTVSRIILEDSDKKIAILHSVHPFSFSSSVNAAKIAGTNYIVGDDHVVWNVGWGKESVDKPMSEQLRHLQALNINYNLCRNIYIPIAIYLDENVICSGWLYPSQAAGQRQGPAGSPIVHNGVIVGLFSYYALVYDSFRFPTLNIKVSAYSPWIVANA